MKIEGFGFDLIAKGSYIDKIENDIYIVHTYMLRLNSVANNAMIVKGNNSRECYETNEEWMQYQLDCEKYFKNINKLITDELGIDLNNGSFSFKQAISEVYTGVHIYKIAGEVCKNEN